MKRLLATIANAQLMTMHAGSSAGEVLSQDVREADTEVLPIQRREQHLSSRAVSNEDLADWSFTR